MAEFILLMSELWSVSELNLTLFLFSTYTHFFGNLTDNTIGALNITIRLTIPKFMSLANSSLLNSRLYLQLPT